MVAPQIPAQVQIFLFIYTDFNKYNRSISVLQAKRNYSQHYLAWQSRSWGLDESAVFSSAPHRAAVGRQEPAA